MKKMLALIGVAALLATVLTSTLSAQVPTYANQTITVPSVLAAGTTNLVATQFIDTTRSGNVAIQTAVSGTTPGWTNIYSFGLTVDGVTYSTNANEVLFVTNAFTATGNATNIQAKNIAVPSYAGLWLYKIVTTGTATNGTHQAGLKISSP